MTGDKFLFLETPSAIAYDHQFFQDWFRAFVRRRFYTLINISGLSLGICAAVGIYLYVTDELRYDQFHSQKNNIYRVATTYRLGGNENRYATTAAPLAEAIRSTIASVDNVTRLYGREAAVEVIAGKVKGEKFREANVFFADPSVFQIFDFSFINGNASALTDHHHVMLSETAREEILWQCVVCAGKRCFV